MIGHHLTDLLVTRARDLLRRPRIQLIAVKVVVDSEHMHVDPEGVHLGDPVLRGDRELGYLELADRVGQRVPASSTASRKLGGVTWE